MMKKCYQIIHTADQPDWAVAPRAQIDQLLWKPQTQITAYAQLVCGDDRLFVHLHADEDAIRAEETDPLAQPCQDSCLEFFLRPTEDLRYFNFEFNPNCALYLGFGENMPALTRLAVQDVIESGQVLDFPLSSKDDGRDLNLVYNKNYQLSNSAERFIRVVKEMYNI